MAGMDWLRWHHGSVNDPKFQLIAKRAGASVAEVIAVWACLLEAASQAESRGNPGEPDFEAMDCSLGLEDGKAQAIYQRMNERGLFTEDGALTAWEKRQPKREREDDTSSDRVRAFRERQRQDKTSSANETPRNASETPETPREEKSREEKKHTSSAEPTRFDAFWEAYPRKVGKDAARKAFDKRRVDDVLLSAMLTAIRAQGLPERCAKGESQFVPHPATWLNEGRWQDEAQAEGAERAVAEPFV